MPTVIHLAAARSERAKAAAQVAEDAELAAAHTLAAEALAGFLAALEARAPGAVEAGAWFLFGEMADHLAAWHGARFTDFAERLEERVALRSNPAPLPPEIRGA